MVVGNETRSVTLAPYYPATLNPVFMGAHPPTRYDFPYDSGSQRVTYFQNYRNETLSRFMMPPYDWGVQKSAYSPKPDIVSGVKGRNLDRLLAVPVNDIESVDPVRLKEVDDLYKLEKSLAEPLVEKKSTSPPCLRDPIVASGFLCVLTIEKLGLIVDDVGGVSLVYEFPIRPAIQMHRDQYKDRTGVVHPLKFFRPDDSYFHGPPSLFPTYISKYPDTYTAHKLPIVLPITYERRIKTPYLPQLSLAGIYSRGQCIAHKV